MRATQQQYTNAVDDLTTWPDSYRTPLPSESMAAEITGVTPSVKGNGITNLFSFEELDGTPGTARHLAKRVERHARHSVRGDPGVGHRRQRSAGHHTHPPHPGAKPHAVPQRRPDHAAAPGPLDPRGLTGQSYQAVLTPGQLDAIFGATGARGDPDRGRLCATDRRHRLVGSLAACLLLAGRHRHAGAGVWQPHSANSFGPADPSTRSARSAAYAYDAYALLPASVTDAVGNLTAVANDYRVLAPALVTDPNGNQRSSRIRRAGHGHRDGGHGQAGRANPRRQPGRHHDRSRCQRHCRRSLPIRWPIPSSLLGNATTRIIYDVNAYQRTSASAQPSPPAIYTLARETHTADLAASPAGTTTQYQFAFAYSDGFSREIQRKARVADGPVTAGGSQVSPRWAGSGWTIFDNKGRAVRRYEPFFSATNQFEFAAQTGVSTVMFYDPPGRVMAVLHPDNTWEKVVFDAWRQDGWDSGDTVLIADPRADADVGGYFQRAIGTGSFTSWYAQRIGGTFGATADDQAAQQEAAQKAAAYAATPSVAHFDTLGRLCLAVTDNGGGAAGRYPTRTALDTEARPLSVTDALGRRAQEFCLRSPQQGGGFQYVAGADMAGNPLYHSNADAGARRSLNNVAGRPIRNWDARGHVFRMVYDPAQRLTQRHVSTNGAAETLIELTIYGEGQAAGNLCGRVFRHYDMAGYIENSQYDFKGNLLQSTRQLAVTYQQAIDWTPLAGLTTGTALDSAATAAGLIPTGDGGRDHFVGGATYDALNRPIQMVTPHNPAMQPDVLRPAYDAGGHPLALDAWLQQAAAPASLLDPATADRHAVTAIAYNARAQRLSIALGNGTATTLLRPPDVPPGGSHHHPARQLRGQPADRAGAGIFLRSGGERHRDPRYRRHPGRDRFQQPTCRAVRRIHLRCADRLIGATGREHLGQTGDALNVPQQVTNDDSFRTSLPQPGDGNAMGVYTENYIYDALGNLLTMGHQVGAGNWTRRYAYAEASQIAAAEIGNRLSATSLPGDVPPDRSARPMPTTRTAT